MKENKYKKLKIIKIEQSVLLVQDCKWSRCTPYLLDVQALGNVALNQSIVDRHIICWNIFLVLEWSESKTVGSYLKP